MTQWQTDYSYLRNYNTELGQISSSLNQITKRINSTGNIYQYDMNEVKELMNEVWHTQKSMLSKQPLIKNEGLFMHIWINLLDNAIKFSPSKGTITMTT